jgi:hypothetical protein
MTKEADTTKAATDTTRAGTDTTTAGTTGDTVYNDEWNTPLPVGVASDPAGFNARLKALKLAGSGAAHTRRRAGSTCSGCSVEVAVQAISQTRNIDPDSLWPNPARALALLQNMDPSRKEAYYGLKPRSQADYYLWADSARGRRLTMLEVPKVSGVVRAGRQKYMEGVPSLFARELGVNYGDADFVESRPEGECEGTSITVKTASMIPFFSTSTLKRILSLPVLATAARSGGWIDCNSGCCW